MTVSIILPTVKPWEPGDPLYDLSRYRRNHLFTIKDDIDSETCRPCPDAARWPDPMPYYDLDATGLAGPLHDLLGSL